MTKQSLPAVSHVTAESLEEFKTMDTIVLVAYAGADEKAANEAFTILAEAQRDNYLFGATDDVALAEAEEVKQPSIVLYKDFDEKKAVYDGKFEQEELLQWIKTASTPLVGEVNPETYSSYMSVS
jgi:protein disulfide-isomerase A1